MTRDIEKRPQKQYNRKIYNYIEDLCKKFDKILENIKKEK